MGYTTFANSRGIAHKGSGGTSIAFPDVCKTPAPPAPFAPIPYPNIQYQENLKKANRVDARAKNGNKRAKKQVDQANMSLNTGYSSSSGDEAGTLKGIVSLKTMGTLTPMAGPSASEKFEGKKSATQCVILGYTMHKSGLAR